MKSIRILSVALVCIVTGAAGCAAEQVRNPGGEDSSLGRVEVSTITIDPAYRLLTATYTPSGKVLFAYTQGDSEDKRQVNLAVMEDDGSNIRPFFSQKVPEREKDNGIRYMVFPDNQRIFLGDFIIECLPDLDSCDQSTLLPVEYPEEVAGGDHVFSGVEKIQMNPSGLSTYTADLKLSGPKPGVMDFKMTFGPIQDKLPARLIFSEDESGTPQTYGYAEYNGQRLDVQSLVP